jgi:Protein of unknown function (DUF2530)
MVPFAVGGMVGFAVAAVIVWLTGAPADWLRVCVAGFLIGVPGLITMIIHDRHRRRRRALTHPTFRVEA